MSASAAIEADDLLTEIPAIEADDLFTEILRRLPIRSIIRSKLVSKHWHSLLSNPYFCSLVRNPKLNPAAGIFIHYKAEDLECSQSPCIDYISFSANKQTLSPMRKEFKIIQSCNGLLLCNTGLEYHVYNPTTNMYSVLPKLNLDGRVTVNRLKTRGMSLAFDPNISPCYKVICWASKCIHVYSSDTRVWTKVPTEYSLLGAAFKGVYWNGSIHWMHDALSYFNIENQTLKRMPRPFEYDWKRKYYLGESCDCLHYAEMRRYEYEISVYELRRDYSGWDHKYRVDIPFAQHLNFYDSILILSVVRGEREEDSFLVLQTMVGVMRYNLASNTSNKLQGLLPGIVYNGAFQYIESLSCV